MGSSLSGVRMRGSLARPVILANLLPAQLHFHLVEDEGTRGGVIADPRVCVEHVGDESIALGFGDHRVHSTNVMRAQSTKLSRVPKSHCLRSVWIRSTRRPLSSARLAYCSGERCR